MYVDHNFKTKKALKQAVTQGVLLTIFQPGLGDPPKPGGTYSVEGPYYPEPHRWYARVTLDARGYICKVS